MTLVRQERPSLSWPLTAEAAKRLLLACFQADYDRPWSIQVTEAGLLGAEDLERILEIIEDDA
jgi:hypothetical protein